ncbi:hypothetical protein [Pelagibacterium lacus]|uniref:DUF883 family protein n=1 Tax=Pelagibacterium lacus TaxID=2282655 RepID=A0A369W2M1_9HYPH|nr:hypothetical protein [Pelagibacterium lacus]RDE08926.1 hypothetical protein DVH29_09250 [Pelagibacterium lacus]
MADFGITDGIGKSLDHQVRDLRKQIDQVSKSLARHGVDFNDLADDAEDLWRGARKNAHRAAKHMRHDADVLGRAMEKAPAGVGTVLTVAALVGFGLGYLVHISQRR